MRSTEILIGKGIAPDKYPADAIFNSFIGTYSEDRQTVCIMAEDNASPEEIEQLINCNIDRDTIKEIAYTVKVLITNMGADVHRHTMKNNKPFCYLKIVKP